MFEIESEKISEISITGMVSGVSEDVMEPEPPVSIITPTCCREALLPLAYRMYTSQQGIAEREWIVIDDSPQPSQFMQGLADPSVRYFHLPQRLSIGEKRNRAIEAARGEIIVQFDDDEYYAPSYIKTMLDVMRSQQADFVKLSAFFLYNFIHQKFGYRDLLKKTSLYFRWKSTGEEEVVRAGPRMIVNSNPLGYGFSYVFRKNVWQCNPFPGISPGEDDKFIRAALRNGHKVTLASDQRGICLRLMHRYNLSGTFSQDIIAEFLARTLFPGFFDMLPEYTAALSQIAGKRREIFETESERMSEISLTRMVSGVSEEAMEPEPPVSIITPTYCREALLPLAYRMYTSQQGIAEREWIVIDDSPQPSQFMQGLADPSVRYFHLPQRLSIGEKRNRAIEAARGEIIVQFDDDEYYAPSYIKTMLDVMRSQQADFVKLSAFFVYSFVLQKFGHWDLLKKNAQYFRWEANGKEEVMNATTPIVHDPLGYGFSYIFRKDVWQRSPFPEISSREDDAFIRAALRNGYKVTLANDQYGVCLRLTHRYNTSNTVSQSIIPEFLARTLFSGFFDMLPGYTAALPQITGTGRNGLKSKV